MKYRTYRWMPILIAAPFALLSVACGGGDEELTAENITLEECNDLFGEAEESEATEADSESEEMIEGDYNADGEVDEADTEIEERCEELMSEDEGSEDEETE